MAALSLHEICQRITRAHREGNTANLNSALEELLLFFPVTGYEVKPYAQTELFPCAPST
jgi:hypothetical protein